MTHVTCRLTAKNRDQLRNPTLGNRVYTFLRYIFKVPETVATTAERIITQESVSSLQLLGLNGAVPAHDLLEHLVSDQLALNGAVVLVLGQPALARKHVRLRALQRTFHTQTPKYETFVPTKKRPSWEQG